MAEPLYSEITKDGRVYHDPVTKKKLRGVTTLIGSATAKPFLKSWGERLVSEKAVARYRELGERITIDGPDDAAQWLATAAEDETRASSHSGNVLHEWAARNDAGEIRSVQDVFDEMMQDPDPRQRPFAANLSKVRRMREHYLTLVDRWKLSFPYNERTIFSRSKQYAGTFDCIMSSPYLHDGALVMGDRKTTKGVKPRAEVAAQLLCYILAEGMWVPTGELDEAGKQLATEEPMPQTVRETAYVIKVSEHKAGLHPINLDGMPQILDAILLVSDWAKNGDKRIGGALDDPNPVTDADVQARIEQALSVEALESIYYWAVLEGAWNSELTDLATIKKKALIVQ